MNTGCGCTAASGPTDAVSSYSGQVLGASTRRINPNMTTTTAPTSTVQPYGQSPLNGWEILVILAASAAIGIWLFPKALDAVAN